MTTVAGGSLEAVTAIAGGSLATRVRESALQARLDRGDRRRSMRPEAPRS